MAIRPLVDLLVADGRIRPIAWPRTLFFLITAGGTAVVSGEALARLVDDRDPREPSILKEHADSVADLIVTGLLIGGDLP